VGALALNRVVSELDDRFRLIKAMFQEQRAAFWRPVARRRVSRRRAVLTTRRAGKSWGILGAMFTEAMMFPRTDYRYVMLTQDQCRDVPFRVAEELNDRFDIGAKFLQDDLKIRLPNQSIIHFYGADKKGWMGRMRGQRSRICAIDEAQDFSRPTDLAELINSVLRPTLIDDRGTLFLVGTPGLFKIGIFYDVTATDESGRSVGTGRLRNWGVYNWGMAHNPHMRQQYLAEVAELRKEHPGVDIMKIPQILREYFARWAEDESDRVYEINLSKVAYDQAWRREEHPNARYVCGIDLGYNDATALTVGAFEPESPDWYVLESHKQIKVPLQYAVDQVKQLEQEYPGIAFVCDPAKKQLMIELQMRCDVFIEAAEKHEKKDWIKLMNRDLHAGHIKIVNAEKSTLVAEMIDSRWVVRPSGKVEEAPGIANDECDAHLYAYRKAYHYRHKPATEAPKPGTREWYELEAKRMRARAISKAKARKVAEDARRR
jgi:hypothetical protein